MMSHAFPLGKNKKGENHANKAAMRTLGKI